MYFKLLNILVFSLIFLKEVKSFQEKLSNPSTPD